MSRYHARMTQAKSSIGIAGAGSIGCFVGGWLSKQAPVALLGRPRVRELLDTYGLRLTDLDDGECTIEPGELEVGTDPSVLSSAGLVLVTVKSDDTEALAGELAPALRPDALVVSVQNGVHNAEVLRTHLPDHEVLRGVVSFNVVHRGHGWLHRATSGGLVVERHPRLTPYLSAFEAAGLPLEPREDMLAVQWSKLLFNLNNAVNALSDLPLRDELALRTYRRCWALLQDEALHALDAAGIRPARLFALPMRWLPRVLRAPDPVFRLLARSLLAAGPLARSSTWEDLAAGRPTEVDYFNGEVVRLARGHGLDAPANARIVELVREAARGDRRVWHRDDLWRELSQSTGDVDA